MTDCTERHTGGPPNDIAREGQKGMAKAAQP